MCVLWFMLLHVVLYFKFLTFRCAKYTLLPRLFDGGATHAITCDEKVTVIYTGIERTRKETVVKRMVQKYSGVRGILCDISAIRIHVSTRNQIGYLKKGHRSDTITLFHLKSFFMIVIPCIFTNRTHNNQNNKIILLF
jgi:hypothetical protein